MRGEYELLREIREVAREYVASGIEEADAEAEWSGVLPGPRQKAARRRLNLAYERMVELVRNV